MGQFGSRVTNVNTGGQQPPQPPVPARLEDLGRGPVGGGLAPRTVEAQPMTGPSSLPPGFSRETGYAAVADLCRGENFEQLALPPELQSGMQRIGMNTFGTRPADKSLYEQDAWVQEALARREAPFAMFGFAGGGMASRTLNCVVVNNDVALFCQISLDFIPGLFGVNRDPDLVHRHVNGWIKGINGLVADIAEAKQRGSWPTGQRLFVVHSDHAPERACLAWVTDGAPADWKKEALPGFMEARSQVRQLGK